MERQTKMRIPITLTELDAMPNVTWRKFYDFIISENAEHTPIQRAASLCMRYYFGAKSNGHKGLLEGFENSEDLNSSKGTKKSKKTKEIKDFRDVDKDEVENALVTFGATDHAENFKKAVETGPEDDYDETDAFFYENMDGILNAVDLYRRNNLEQFYELFDENYTLVPPKDGFWAAIFIVAVVFIFAIIAGAQNPDGLPFILISIGALVVLALILTLYAKRWRISVRKDVLTARFLIRTGRIVRISEISGANKNSKGLVVYAYGRKLVFVSGQARQYPMFSAQLDLAGKIVDKQVAGFVIRYPKVNRTNSYLWPAFSIGALIWTFQRQGVPATIYEKIFFSAAVLVAVWYFLHCLLWKVILSENNILLIKAFRGESVYELSDITRVSFDKQKMVMLFSDGKSAAVALACEGHEDLITRLQTANIPFFRDGKPLRNERVPISDQLKVLANLGVCPNHVDFAQWVYDEFGIEAVSADPLELLTFLGSARQSGDVLQILSDDVYSFGVECVTDSTAYVAILNRMAALSKGVFDITDPHSKVDHKKKKATVSFTYDNTDHEWDLAYDGNCVDYGIIARINSLLQKSGSQSFFYSSQPGQSVILLFDSGQMIEKLDKLTNHPFILGIEDFK